MANLDPEKLVSERANQIEASGIRRVFDLAATLSAPVNLSIGQPDYNVPSELIEECRLQMENGHNRYTPTAGIAPLRNKLLDKAAGFGYTPESVIVTCGTCGGLTLGLLALVNPGDDVLIPDPFFVAYKHLVTLAGGRPVPYDTYPDFHHVLDPIRQAFTDNTKIVLINNPANPTGAKPPDDELLQAVRFVESHGAMVFADEIYSTFAYDAPFTSMGTFGEHVMVFNSLSKSHAMTGWRIGWAFGPSVVIDQMAKIQQFTFVNAPSMVQHTALAALDYDMSANIEAYRAKRDMFCDGLRDAGYRFVRPQGAFYVFPESPWGTGTAFVETAVANNLLIVPGGVFSYRDTHFRISFAASDETLHKGLDILRRLINPDMGTPASHTAAR